MKGILVCRLVLPSGANMNKGVGKTSMNDPETIMYSEDSVGLETPLFMKRDATVGLHHRQQDATVGLHHRQQDTTEDLHHRQQDACKKSSPSIQSQQSTSLFDGRNYQISCEPSPIRNFQLTRSTAVYSDKNPSMHRVDNQDAIEFSVNGNATHNNENKNIIIISESEKKQFLEIPSTTVSKRGNKLQGSVLVARSDTMYYCTDDESKATQDEINKKRAHRRKKRDWMKKNKNKVSKKKAGNEEDLANQMVPQVVTSNQNHPMIVVTDYENHNGDPRGRYGTIVERDSDSYPLYTNGGRTSEHIYDNITSDSNNSHDSIRNENKSFMARSCPLNKDHTNCPINDCFNNNFDNKNDDTDDYQQLTSQQICLFIDDQLHSRKECSFIEHGSEHDAVWLPTVDIPGHTLSELLDRSIESVI